MAFSFLNKLTKGKFFCHLIGAFHSAGFPGIIYCLKYCNPSINVITVFVINRDEVFPLKDEHRRVTGNTNVLE
jgi:hypothetical protein